jgi:putative membrane protein
MKILVLNVDRDDDFGVKAGLHSPFIGREENLDAAMQLGLKDPEDSDTNTLLAAISIYDEMIKKGMEVEVATICGDPKVGYESDLALATQLENILEVIKADRVILVSDGAEDEYIYPMVFSRIKVDSVRRVWVKQAPTVEGTYYILINMMKDDKVRKRILTPLGLILLVLGVFSILPKIIELINNPALYGLVSDMALGMLSLVLGIYLLFYAYKVGERTKAWSKRTGKMIRSGSQVILFSIVSAIFLVIGLFFGAEAANSNPDGDWAVRTLLFISGTLWMWVFAFFSYETGRFVNRYLQLGKVYWSYMVVALSIFAIGFLLQGTIDASLSFLGYQRLEQSLVVLELAAGFLLMGFGGLLNLRMRMLSKGDAPATPEKTIEYPEG